LELSSWFAEYNQLVFMIICAVAMVYWVKQLKIFETMKKTKILQRTLSLNKFPNPKPWDKENHIL
jgi:hypothetical protein